MSVTSGSISAGPDGLVAVLLAGGRGTRLGDLTAQQSKPAVNFLDGRRIVDFVMANALRSGIDPLLVCTQWKPDTLVSHLEDNWSAGFPRGLAIRDGAAMAPATGYLGTAHAVACNAAEIDASGARQVLVLAADHIYDMDYREMLAAHRAMGLPVTVATLPVAREEARSFGVFETRGPCHALRFLEKPDDPPPMYGHPDRAMISMGIYVFDWAWLREALGCGARPLAVPPLDFGHDLLPFAVERGEVGVHCFARKDSSEPPYWRDVGTTKALAEARADFARKAAPFALPRFPSAARRQPVASLQDRACTVPPHLSV